VRLTLALREKEGEQERERAPKRVRNYAENRDVSHDAKSALRLSQHIVDVSTHYKPYSVKRRQRNTGDNQNASTHKKKREAHTALNESPSIYL